MSEASNANDKEDLNNLLRESEERLLRVLDGMKDSRIANIFDQRWLAIARTHFEEGFMAVNRSVQRPGRASLPEDEDKPTSAMREAGSDQ